MTTLRPLQLKNKMHLTGHGSIALVKLRLENCEFEASSGYITRPYLKKQINKKHKIQ
jgi:hypothetical protein